MLFKMAMTCSTISCSLRRLRAHGGDGTDHLKTAHELTCMLYVVSILP